MQETGRSNISSSVVPFQLIGGEAYYDALLGRILQAKERITIVTMAFLWGPKVDVILLAIEKSAARGVAVHIVLDVYTLKGLAHPHLPAAARRLQLTKTHEAIKQLRAQGVKVTQFGKIGLNPFKGRCHVKLTVIDDDCFSFGGVNVTDDSFAFADYMLHTRSAELADCLEQLADRIARQRPPLPNGEVALDSQSSILFDGGKAKQSLIYERATMLAAQASQIYYVSQMVPSGRLGELLRRKPSELYYNRPDQLSAPANWGQAFDEQKHRLQNSYTHKEYIHAKLMLFEMPNGDRCCLTGSHNFSYRGVSFGTQEIALVSYNVELWEQLYEFLRIRIVR